MVETSTNLLSLLENNLEQEAVWTFFTGCLDSKVWTTVAGIRRSLPQFLLSSLVQSGTLTTSKDQLKAKLTDALVKSSKSESAVESKNFLMFLNPSPSLLSEQLNNIWGPEAFSGKRTSGRTGGRGKFSLLYGASEDAAEAEARWEDGESKVCGLY